jgi:hypothetical protein
MNNDKWYDRVYLCIEKDGENNGVIQGFNCYTFKDFKDVDAYKKKLNFSSEKRIALIPMCKWIPCIFHKYYLNNILRDFYWKNNITIYRNSTRR